MSEVFAAVERAARAYIDSSEPGHLTGKLAEAEHWGRLGIQRSPVRSETVLDDLTVRSVNGTEATVDLLANQRVWVTHRLGEVEKSNILTSPMTLRLVDGDWKVANFSLNGRSLADDWFIHRGGAIEHHGIRLQSRATVLHPGRYDHFFTAWNDRDDPLWAREVFERKRLGWLKLGTLLADVQVMPREERVLAASIPVNTPAGRAEPTETGNEVPPIVQEYPSARDFRFVVPFFDCGRRRWIHPRLSVSFGEGNR